MSPETLAAIASALSSGSVIGSAWFWYDKKRSDKRVDELDIKVTNIINQQTEHENKFITESRTRELLQEYLHNLEQRHAETSADVKELKSMLSELNTQLRVINAVKAYEEKNS